MEYHAFDCGPSRAHAQAACFAGRGGTSEFHLLIRPTEPADINAQAAQLEQAYRHALAKLELEPQTAILRRFFCRNIATQSSVLSSRGYSRPFAPDEPCAVSWVGQPPAPPAKVALWAYHVSDANGESEKTLSDATLTWTRGEQKHCWTTGLKCTDGETAYDQTTRILEQYGDLLRRHGMSLAQNVVRTWLFVDGIDAHYADVVAARRDLFRRNGLTPSTHFIASTGIEAAAATPGVKLVIDAYAIAGLRSEQVRFLTAPDHLGSPYAYGVTFERGTAISYRDRRHVIISGTASIDPQGRILHPGDALRQLDRALVNIGALLDSAHATFDDACVLIAYVRNAADQASVQQRLRQRFGDLPFLVVMAAVCRPEWLVEVEALAIVPTDNADLPPF